MVLQFVEPQLRRQPLQLLLLQVHGDPPATFVRNIVETIVKLANQQKSHQSCSSRKSTDAVLERLAARPNCSRHIVSFIYIIIDVFWCSTKFNVENIAIFLIYGSFDCFFVVIVSLNFEL